MATKAKKPAAKPKPKSASKPDTRPASKPQAAPRPAAKAASKPAAHSPSKQTQRAAQRPSSPAKSQPKAKPGGGAHPAAHKAATGKAKPKAKGKATKPKPKPHAAAQAASAGNPPESDYQKEIDVLRGEIATLDITGPWVSETAPKFTGIWGKILQNINAGVSLRNALATLNHSAAATRDNAAKVLALVKAHKVPTFKPIKGR